MSSRSTQVIDEGRRKTLVVEQSLAVIDSVHAALHRGVLFNLTVVDPALVDNGVAEILIQTPATAVGVRPQMIVEGGCGGDARGEIFEGTTFSDAGTAGNLYQRCRCFAGVTSLNTTVTTSPTLTLDGTKIYDTYLYGGTGGKAVGAAGGAALEFGLADSSTYLLRLTNLSGQTQPVNIDLLIYELPITDYPGQEELGL